MGREIRRVPPGWEHPRDSLARYVGLHDKTYLSAVWSHIRYDLRHYLTRPFDLAEFFKGWPEPQYYRKRWANKPTHYQVYETVSEGTPTSPVFSTLEQLEEWLVEQGYSEHAAHAFAQEGWAPSMVMRVQPTGTTIKSDIHTFDDWPASAS